MRNKSLLTEAKQIERAVTLIKLGARLQVLESETDMSYERLLRLYKEVAGKSPSKGQLPFSTDWFMTWQPNVHSSLFMGFHRFFAKRAGVQGLDAILKSYHLYLDHIESGAMEPVLSLTRAWTLVRFFDADLLQLAPCTCCGGQFVVHAHDPVHSYVCGLCNMPSRAGSARKKATSRRAGSRTRPPATFPPSTNATVPVP